MESRQGFLYFFQIINYLNGPLLALLNIYLNPKKPSM